MHSSEKLEKISTFPILNFSEKNMEDSRIDFEYRMEYFQDNFHKLSTLIGWIELENEFLDHISFYE